VVHAIKNTPSCLDWKLVYRDPLPTWISEHARIALIGDSAHPFLPTSVQGASQAIEDGVTVATVLKLCGSKEEIPTAMLAYENIRYDHVCQAQETGKSIREMWHKADLYAQEFDPESIKMPFRPWIFENDAEKVAIAKVSVLGLSVLTNSIRKSRRRLRRVNCLDRAGRRRRKSVD
jgi:2-polyprenyl-6-methoxyphenol hydroxylase-like FAD-dependent oxidoreductase